MSPNYHPDNSFTIYSRSRDKKQLLRQEYPRPIEILDPGDDVLFLKYSRPNPTPDTDVRAELVSIMGTYGYSLDKKSSSYLKDIINAKMYLFRVRVRDQGFKIFST
ncbi:hypothetical protein ASPFODRAFT_212987 [Aspergillus luchuensis CBS 106.47]|uniref:Uncharacterized protein n=1 Tax=Aspergillus luchuensis (strain CBS 106.47) TaxID=1137211 RepID=A0A1M3SZL3_ASPLC|nr:hypothetical protein ASPFODRAFT_212987 [Aspergillus luchuensis CBS 106.47]